jgi:HKD family nuclease
MSYELFVQPGGSLVGDRLIAELSQGGWNEFRCSVAFAKMSGVKYLDGPLRSFTQSGGFASISVGVDHDGTSFEAASHLLGAVSNNGCVFVVKHIGATRPTFHPKVFLFLKRPEGGEQERALLIVGSTNLTEGGLFTNYETASGWSPDLADPAQASALMQAAASLDAVVDPTNGLCIELDTTQLLDLNQRGWLPTEGEIAQKSAIARAAIGGSQTAGAARRSPPRGLRRQPKLPKIGHSTEIGAPAVALPNVPVPARPKPLAQPARPSHRARPAVARRASAGTHRALVIDISTGTKLTELYLAKAPLQADPAFFGHPFTGLTTPRRGDPQPERRPVVDLELVNASGRTVSQLLGQQIKIWQYANGDRANQDVRVIIPVELLRSLPAGCILEMIKEPVPQGRDYRMVFLTPGSSQWEAARAVATTSLPNSHRRYGWH